MDSSNDYPYYKTFTFNASLCGQELKVVSKQGLPHWDKITPAAQLLTQAVRVRKGRRTLILGCGNGASGAALARQQGGEGLFLVDTNSVALRVAKMTLAANGFQGISVEPLYYPLPEMTYDTVVMDLPKSRKLARRWLLEAWVTLRMEGELYLAGANSEGIQSAVKDAGNLFGNVSVLSYRKGCRVARMIKRSNQHEPTNANRLEAVIDWIAQPGLAPGSWFEFTASTGGDTFKIRSLPGVFSYDQVDEGTNLLLKLVYPDQVKGRGVLDFGCGYGLIGMVAARLDAAWVDLIDVDLSAIVAARENISRNGITNAQALPSDLLDAVIGSRYDLILSNPPFHTGKDVDYGIANTFITQSKSILNPGGRLVLVANRFIPYDRLMTESFGNVKRLTETGKYQVLESDIPILH